MSGGPQCLANQLCSLGPWSEWSFGLGTVELNPPSTAEAQSQSPACALQHHVPMRTRLMHENLSLPLLEKGGGGMGRGLGAGMLGWEVANGVQPWQRGWGGQVERAHKRGMRILAAAWSWRYQSKPRHCRAQSLSGATKTSSQANSHAQTGGH